MEDGNEKVQKQRMEDGNGKVETQRMEDGKCRKIKVDEWERYQQRQRGHDQK